jgi:hypothetical protein
LKGFGVEKIKSRENMCPVAEKSLDEKEHGECI